MNVVQAATGASSRCRRPRSATRSRARCSTSCSTSRREGSPSSARPSVPREARPPLSVPGHRLVLASGNPHKLEELRRALPGREIALVDAGEPPPEDGATYEENARIKARWGRGQRAGRRLGVGEDSGIEAAALDGVRASTPRGGRPATPSGGCSTPSPTARSPAGVRLRAGLAPDGREVARGALDGTIAVPRPRGGLRVRPRSSRWGASHGRSWRRLEAQALAPRPRGDELASPTAGCDAPPAHGRGPATAAVPDSGGASSSAAPGAGRFGSHRTPGDPVREDVVQCGAEHDHVRHHVEPDEQEERRSEGLERDDLRREEHEQRQRLQRAHEHDRPEDRAQAAPPDASGGRSAAG